LAQGTHPTVTETFAFLAFCVLFSFLLRKGGIKEPVFRPPGKQFLLFPTSFHSNTDLLKPGVAERYSKVSRLHTGGHTAYQVQGLTSLTGRVATALACSTSSLWRLAPETSPCLQ
jgi:hypothetical protein